MSLKTLTFLVGAGCAIVAASAAIAQSSIMVSGGQRCVISNGTPNHAIGQFPNRGNPHSFRAQSVKMCVDATPELTGSIARDTNASGITLTGIVIRPGTADFYDPSSPRGHSRDPRSGWRLEGMGAAETLGMDSQNGHVDNRGLYHYHGMSPALAASLRGTHIGYAADGFEIHYAGATAKSSWQLKPGRRQTAPGGAHDGTYEEDWVYVRGTGNLDECNGALVDGQYTYFATDTFPFFPRCFKGTVSASFLGRP